MLAAPIAQNCSTRRARIGAVALSFPMLFGCSHASDGAPVARQPTRISTSSSPERIEGNEVGVRDARSSAPATSTSTAEGGATCTAERADDLVGTGALGAADHA